MPYTRQEARKKFAELLGLHEFTPGKKTFVKVFSAQMKETGGLSPVGQVWDGPLWFSTRRSGDAAIESAGLRVGVLVARGKTGVVDDQEERSEDYLDRSIEAVLDVVKNNMQLEGFWNYIEFAAESYLDYPPIETGTQYRREIIDLRVYLGVGV